MSDPPCTLSYHVCLQDLQRQLRANEQAAIEGREAMQAALELRHK